MKNTLEVDVAALIKRNARKNATVGPVGVGYGNFAVPGLLKNQHVRLSIGQSMKEDAPPTYHLSINFDEAEKVAIQMLRVIMEHGDHKFSDIKRKLLAAHEFHPYWKPTED